MRKLLAVYPQLAGVRVECAWSGLMATRATGWCRSARCRRASGMPWASAATAWAATTMAGELVAAAIAEGDGRYRSWFAPFGLDWTGGPVGLVAVEAIYRWYPIQGLAEGVSQAPFAHG